MPLFGQCRKIVGKRFVMVPVVILMKDMDVGNSCPGKCSSANNAFFCCCIRLNCAPCLLVSSMNSVLVLTSTGGFLGESSIVSA